MTTTEAIATIGSWNLGGVYTEESPSQVQGRLLSILNAARLKVLEMWYRDQKYVPQEYYQRFELTNVFTGECKGDFIANLPATIATLPAPKRTGADGLFPNCDTSKPLTLIYSERELQSYKTHTSMSAYFRFGMYVITGLEIRGTMRNGQVPSKFLLRAVLSEPQKAINFNVDMDPYPAPDGFMSDVKKLLMSDEGRKFFIPSDQISNSKNDVDANASARR